ncbi:c-type cytochrome [Sandaracinobacteroides saxicola]|uniref:Cytochrome c family protein n=1 Tax=Sandaracinobacteroides saxicola TaxID=2759707 RepID=A0A7G5IJA1_9SPHN|nr:cytochrome c family protein [Sandaracinobacteroides saxicola]QMW23443.1 cytochrome c family protein [Sandaracinobacteroides saxicola]
MIRLTLALLLLATTPAGAQDAAQLKRGQLLFLQCKACHTVEKAGAHKVGPNLFGIVGAAAGTRPGFTLYSDALKSSGLTWDDATLDRYLASPAAMVKGNKMAFAGLKQPQDRAAVIAWLKSAAK